MEDEQHKQPIKKSQEKVGWYNYVPAITGVLIFFGVLRLVTYYIQFKINIVPYLEFSEILTSFLDFISLIITLLASILILVGYIYFRYRAYDAHKYVSGWIRKSISKINFIFLLIFVISCFIMLISNFLDRIVGNIITCFFLFIFFALNIYENALNGKTTISERRFEIIGMLVIFLIFEIIFLSFFDVNAVKEEKRTYGTKVVLDNDSTLISDSTNYFVGKTQNFVFIYHEKDKTADAIPMTRVKQITTAPNND